MGSDDFFKKRRAENKRRKAANKEPHPDSYLIVCEGQTEQFYFQSIANRIKRDHDKRAIIDVYGEGRSTMSLLERAQELDKQGHVRYQHRWLVFDKDAFDDFDAAIETAKRAGFKVAWSNECFELWLYLHFDYCDSQLDRAQWVVKLDEIFRQWGVRIGGFRKALPNIYELVTEYGNYGRAKGWAEQLAQESSRYKLPSRRNPCTYVYKLTEELMKILAKPR